MPTIIKRTSQDFTIDGLRLPKKFIVHLRNERNGILPYELICFQSSGVRYSYPNLYDTIVDDVAFIETYSEHRHLAVLTESIRQTFTDSSNPTIELYSSEGMPRPFFRVNDKFKIGESGNPFRVVSVEPTTAETEIVSLNRPGTIEEVNKLLTTGEKLYLQNKQADILKHINQIHSGTF